MSGTPFGTTQVLIQAFLGWVFSVPAVARWGITLVFAALVVALSVTPGVARPGDNAFVWIVVNTPAPLQKLMHVVVYATLALLWMWTLESIESRLVRITLVIVATVGLGAVLEWHQTSVPGRFGTIFDVALNTLGALVGLAIALFLL
jgi:hypothetical protein